jgi:hypothetical protein
MLDVCPLCQRPLRNGTDGPNIIKYPQEYRDKFDAGEITLEELNEHAQVYYERARLCFNEGNQNTFTDGDGKTHLLNPPCSNFYGIRGGTIENPDTVVEYVTIEDN